MGYTLKKLKSVFNDLLKMKEKWEINVESDSYINTQNFNTKEFANEWKLFKENLEWYPYSYWKFKPFSGKYITVDSAGNRKTINNETINSIRIIVIGGSTVWGMGVPDDKTLPSFLSHFLNKNGVNADVINLGQIGYNTTQDLINLIEYMKSNNSPNFVISYGGLNDLLAGLENNRAVPYHEINRMREFNILKSKTRLIKAFFNVEDNPQIFTHDKSLLYKLVENYKNNLNIIEALKDRFDYTPLFYLHPTIFHKNKLTPFEAEQKQFLNYARKNIEEFYDLISDNFKNEDLKNFTNLSKCLFDICAPCYVDHAHLSENGNSVIAQKICDDIINLINTAEQSTITIT